MSKQIILPYNPFPKQKLFHASNALYRLFGGAAGPGKSEAIMWEGVVKCLLKKTDGVLFRKSYPELEMSLIKRFLEKVPNELYTYNAQRHTAYFKNGSTLLFAYCDNDNDVYRYQSAEFDFIGVDELTHFNEFFFTYIISRLRTTKANITPSFFAATNPGNIGNVWVRKRWITKDSQQPGYKKEDYDFVSAVVYDNPILMQTDPSYIKKLNQLPDAQRKALLEGSFDVFEGQFFSEWSPRHIINPFMPLHTDLIVGGLDWGRTHAFAFYLATVNKELYDEEYFYRTRVFFEVWGHDKNPGEWATAIKTKLKQFQLTLNDVTWIRADPAIFKKKEDNSIGIADMFKKEGFKLDKADNDRINGAAVFHDWLSDAPDGNPYLQFTSNCPNAIETIPTLIHDKNRPEDVNSDGDDDAYDSVRYLIKHLKWMDGHKASVALHNAPRRVPVQPHATMVNNKQLSIDTSAFEK